MQKIKIVGFSTLLLVVLAIPMFALTGCLGGNNGGGGSSTLTPNTQITMANFNRIEHGMTLAQVTEILGTTGRTLSSSAHMPAIPGIMDAITTEIWQWEFSRGFDIRIVLITFQNDAMFSKAQTGL